MLKKLQVPYTVMLLIFGCLFGLLSSRMPELQVYTALTRADPHVILHIFLPILLFESAFSTDIHTFLQSLSQVVLLATVGLGKILYSTQIPLGNAIYKCLIESIDTRHVGVRQSLFNC